MAIAVGLGGEQQGAVGTLVGLLAGVCQDMASQRGRPRELAMTVGAGHPVGGQAVGRLLLLWDLCGVLRFRSTK